MNKNTPWTAAEENNALDLRVAGLSYSEIGKELGRSTRSVEKKFAKFRKLGDSYEPRDPAAAHKALTVKRDFELPKPEFGYLPLNIIDESEWVRLGLVSDTHLACKECRLDALHTQYDLFAKEGVTTVLHAGNIVDGYIARINGDSVLETTIDGQAQYTIDNYPARKGITTHFITGDDHESWFAPGFNFGAYLSMLAKEQGREDLLYIGHVEADVEVKVKGASASTMLKVQHPGGGSSYARSYAGQKQVESLQGGEKPAILVQGHYHVSNYMIERNIHVIGMPGFQDQTIFARKKRLRMDIGGALLEFKVHKDTGAVTRCKLEFNMFFDRGFYKPYLRSDKKILKGHLVINK